MIKVFTGPMYADKSKSLIDEYNKIWNKDRVICFKPSKDTREYSMIHSRNSNINIKAIVIRSIDDIPEHLGDNISTIFIDEIQFLDGDASILVDLSINKDIDIYVAGLSMTSELKPFGIMPEVLSIANEIVHLKACCSDCNKYNAEYTYCLEEKQDDVLVGSSQYIPLCGRCLVKRKTGR